MKASTTAPPPPAPATTTPAIAVDGVAYSYRDRQALNGVSLDVPAGSIFGLLGPNGSGKSTLLSLIIGRRTPDTGHITVLGEPLAPKARARVGMVFQERTLDPLMTVRETMMLQARLFNLPRQHRAEVDEMLARVGLLDRARSLTSTLSGGMKRRLELARALLTRPEVLLLDEPTLALDPDSRQAIWRHLTDVNAAGCTLLLATNDVYEAERYCHTVALLDEGRVVATGTPADLKHELRDEAVRIDWRDDPSALVAALEAEPGVGHVRLARRTTHVTADDASAFLARLFQRWGGEVHAVNIEPTTLEDVYFQLVGRTIAPDAGSEAQ